MSRPFSEFVLAAQWFDMMPAKFFLKNFCGASGLLVMSLLGFRARGGSLIHAWHRHTCYTFPKIHLWCDTCWTIDGQHSSQAWARNWNLSCHRLSGCLTELYRILTQPRMTYQLKLPWCLLLIKHRYKEKKTFACYETESSPGRETPLKMRKIVITTLGLE